MIPFAESLDIVMQSAIRLDEEMVSLLQSQGRILSQDIFSDMDMPPFNKSAMDGYAYRNQDTEKPLTVIETIPAGYLPQKRLGPGECAKIMTGGVVPQGADKVVMVEHTESHNNTVSITRKSNARNICWQAEDIKKGDLVISRGTRINPAEIAVLASVGCDPVPVSRKPVIGIAATGSELVEPKQNPQSAQIRNSNSYQLFSQIEEAGAQPMYLGIVEDTPEATGAIIDKEFAKVDIFLFSGGVSMGDYDYVPEVLKAKGFDLFFQKIAMKPGKPVVFGRKQDTFVFGLPGNPVSTFMVFELFVKPFAYRLMGGEYKPLTYQATLKNTIKRKKAERQAFIPVFCDSHGNVSSINYHGSGHIHAYVHANGFISIPVGVKEIPEGERVAVTFI